MRWAEISGTLGPEVDKGSMPVGNDRDNGVQPRQRCWLKSSYSSGSGRCVEISFELGDVLIRDSKYRRKPEADLRVEPIISVPLDVWLRFLDEFTGSASLGTDELAAEATSDDTVVFRSGNDGTELFFTPAEIAAFSAGVEKGELRPDFIAI